METTPPLGRAIGRPRVKAGRHHLFWVVLVAGLPASLGWASSAQAQPIRYTLDAEVGTFDNGDPLGLERAQLKIVYEFDPSTADGSASGTNDGQGNLVFTLVYFDSLIGVNSTTASLTIVGSGTVGTYAGDIVTQWTFRDASGPNPGPDSVRFPPVTFDIAGAQIRYPAFTVEFDPTFTSGTAPFEFDPDDYTALELQSLSYLGISSSAPLVNAQLSAAFILADEDGDGITAEDACPASDLAATVVIDGCDAGVDNALDAIGCTISDLVALCALDASDHGGFVGCVDLLTDDLKSGGVIAGRDKGAIQSCAARADLP